jgi:hypothetical protein
MKPMLTLSLSAAALVALVASSAAAQDVSWRNQDMDARPNLQSEQTVGGLTSKPGVNVQQPEAKTRSGFGRRPARASKTPPHFPGPRPGGRVTAHKTSRTSAANTAAPAPPR